MCDESTSTLDGKGLSSMRVVDLKQQLEKRGLSKSGSKKDLVKRLKQTLELEKLHESSPDGESRLNLDEATEQNEFVKKYLAEQAERRQREVQRLIELEELQKQEQEENAYSDSDINKEQKQEENICEDSDVNNEEQFDVYSKTGESSNKNIAEQKKYDCVNYTSIIDKNKTESYKNRNVSELTNVEKKAFESYDENNADVERLHILSEGLSETLESNVDKFEKDCKNKNELINKSDKSKNITNNSETNIFVQVEPVKSGQDKNNVNVGNTVCSEKQFSSCIGSSSQNMSVLKECIEKSNKRKNSSSSYMKKSCLNDMADGSKSKQTTKNEVPTVSKKEMVSYSLADIQLPETPMSVTVSSESVADNADSVYEKSEKNSHSDDSDINASKQVTNSCSENVSKGPEHTLNSSEHQLKKHLSDKFSSDDSRERKQDNDQLQSSQFRSESENDKNVMENEEILENKENNSPSNDNVKSDKIEESSEHEEVSSKRLTDTAESSVESASDKESNEKMDISKSNAVSKSEGSDVESRHSVRSNSSSGRSSPELSENEKDKTRSEGEIDSENEEESPRYRKNKETNENRKNWKKRRHDSESSSGSDSGSYSSDSSQERKPYRRKYNDSENHSDSQQYRSKSHSKSPISKSNEKIDRSQTSSLQVEHQSPTEHAPKLRRLKINRKNSLVDNLPAKGGDERTVQKNVLESHHNNGESSCDVGTDVEISNQGSEILSKESVEPPQKMRKMNLTCKLSCAVKSGKSNEDHKVDGKRRRWGSFSASLPKTTVSISTDSLKTIIPDFKITCGPPIISDVDDTKKAVDFSPTKDVKSISLSISKSSKKDVTQDDSDKLTVMEIVEEITEESCDAEKAENNAASHHPCSKILFIKNLVRPFTLMQLKELLKQTGVIVEEGFWIDKIKSKCFVTYEDESQAIRTREALNGVRWPTSNPKILSADFATQEELDFHRNMTDQPKPPVAVRQTSNEKQEKLAPVESSKKKEKEERKKEKQKQNTTYIREWDKDKLSQDSPDRQLVSKDAERSRSSSEKRKDKKDSKKKQDEETPAKLLDDLFHKTKTLPSIYWLPLTEEEVREREEERKRRRVEREKRRQEEQEEDRQSRRRPYVGREKENRSRSHSPRRR